MIAMLPGGDHKAVVRLIDSLVAAGSNLGNGAQGELNGC
jgi:hypothetical protein